MPVNCATFPQQRGGHLLAGHPAGVDGHRGEGPQLGVQSQGHPPRESDGLEVHVFESAPKIYFVVLFRILDPFL